MSLIKYLLLFVLLASFSFGGAAMVEHADLSQKVIILLGPPGSGKGTQAKKLADTLKMSHISTGDLFRENISQKTVLGAKAKTFMDKGQLVPDSLVLEMLFDRVSRDDCKKGYILDGFPRTIPQADALDRALGNKVALVAINLPVSDEEILKRISGRLTCTLCGNMHNAYYSPSKIQGKCDKCGGELQQRSDDKPEVVQERLEVYRKQTAPLIRYYEAKGVLKTVNGEQRPEQIFRQILAFS